MIEPAPILRQGSRPRRLRGKPLDPWPPLCGNGAREQPDKALRRAFRQFCEDTSPTSTIMSALLFSAPSLSGILQRRALRSLLERNVRRINPHETSWRASAQSLILRHLVQWNRCGTRCTPAPKNTGNDQEYQSSVQSIPTGKQLSALRHGRIDGPHAAEQHRRIQERIGPRQRFEVHVPAHSEHQRKGHQNQRHGRMAQHPSNKTMRVEQALAAGFVAENLGSQLTTAVRTSAEAGSSLEAWLPESRPRPNSWRDRQTDSRRPVSAWRICRSDCIARRDRRAARRTAACG